MSCVVQPWRYGDGDRYIRFDISVYIIWISVIAIMPSIERKDGVDINQAM
jgi:hypothetical protein